MVGDKVLTARCRWNGTSSVSAECQNSDNCVANHCGSHGVCLDKATSTVVFPCVSTRVDPPDSPVPCDEDHGWRVFDNLMDSWSSRKTCCGAIPLQCQVCFSESILSMVEAPIVRETVIDDGSENLHSSEAVRRPAVFPMTDDAEGELPQSPRRRGPTRRLVLVPLSTGTPQSVQDRVPSHDSVPIGHHRDEEADGSDTVSLPSQADSGFRGQGSDASGNDEFGKLPVMVEVPPVRPSVAVMRRGFVALDDWDLEEVFSRRGSLMRSVPRFLWGSFRVATKLALDEIVQGNASGNELQQERGWKFF